MEIDGIDLSFGAEGGVERISLNSFNVATTTKKGKEEADYAKQIPSLLGLDFLREAGLALYVDPSKNIAFLERKE